MSGLTTHVLDTGLGQPAKGVMVDVFRINAGGEGRIVGVAVKNQCRRSQAVTVFQLKRHRTAARKPRPSGHGGS